MAHSMQRWLARLLLVLMLVQSGVFPAQPRPVNAAPQRSTPQLSRPLPNVIAYHDQTPTFDQPASSSNDGIDPSWDAEHFPVFNLVLAKPFAVGPTYQDADTDAHTVQGPNNTLHSVFYQYAEGNRVAGWYYTTSPHIQNGRVDLTTPITAALVIETPEPRKYGIYARIAVDDGGGVHIIWLDNVNYDQLYYKYCSTNCLATTAWTTDPTIIIDVRPQNCKLNYPTIVAWGSGASRQVIVGTAKVSTEEKPILWNRYSNGVWQYTANQAGNSYYGLGDTTSIFNKHDIPLFVEDTTQTVHAIWLEKQHKENGTTDERRGVRYAQLPLNGSWTSPIWLTSAGLYDAQQVVSLGDELPTNPFVNHFTLTIDAQGAIHAAWPEWVDATYGDKGYMIGTQQRFKWTRCTSGCTSAGSWSSSTDVGSSIQNPAKLDNHTVDRDIRLASAPDGRVFALWRQIEPLNGTTPMRVLFGIWDPQKGWIGSSVVREDRYSQTNPYIPSYDIRNMDLNITSAGEPQITWMRFQVNGKYYTEYIPIGIPADQFAGKCPCDQGTQLHIIRGDPVNTYSGSFYYQVPDLSIPTNGKSLQFERHYTSLFASDARIGDSPFGRGWRHSFDIRQSTDPYLTTYELPTGNRLRFGLGQSTGAVGIKATNYFEQSLITQNGIRYSFDNGLITSIREGAGDTTSFQYTGGLLTSVKDTATQRTLTFTYTAAPISGMYRVTAVGDQFGHQVRYSYTAQGLLETATDVRGGVTTYTYDANGLLRSIIDPLGVTQIVNTYQNGRITNQVDALGNQTTYTTQQTGSNVNTTMTIQRASGTLDTSVDGYRTDGTPRFQSHNGQLVGYTAFKNGALPSFQVDSQGHAQRMESTAQGLPLTMTDVLGNMTRLDYNSSNRPTQVVANSITTTLRYTELNSTPYLTQTTILAADGLKQTTIYTYINDWNYAYPRLSDQRSPDGVITHHEYTHDGELKYVTIGYLTPLAQTTAYTRDAMGRVTDVTTGYGTPFALTTKTVYRADGLVERTIQNYRGTGTYDAHFPDRNIPTFYGYDLLGRQIWTRSVDGRYHGVTSYDAVGRVRWVVDNPTNLTGQPTLPNTSMTAPMPSYSILQPAGNVGMAYGYDALGRTTLLTQTGILTGTFIPTAERFTNATIRVTRTEYDHLSRPVTVTMNYRPDMPVGVLADVNVQTITRYDANGNVIGQRDALGRWTTIAYDALNRPITTTLNFVQNPNPALYPGSELQDFNLVSVTRYNTQGNVERTIENYANGIYDPTEPLTDRIALYQYDGFGRTIAITTNASLSVPANRTDLNRVTATFYDPATGRQVATRDALGQWTHTDYDLLGRPTTTIQNCRTNANVPSPLTCAPFDAQYPDRNVRSIMRYDAVGRSFERVDPLGVVSRTNYDALGRTQASIANYVTNAPTSAITNVTSLTAYNSLGQVITTTNALGQITTQQYNGLGQVVARTDAANRTTRSGYDGTGQQRWSRTPDGRYTVTLIDGLGRTTQTIVNYEDGQVTSADGTDRDLSSRIRYDAAGRTIASIDSMGRETRMQYTARDQLRAVQENVQTPCTTTDCNLTTWYSYDRMGNQRWMVDARGNTQRTTTYDSAGRPVNRTDALGQTTAWQYDAASRVTLVDDPRGAANDITYQYDQLGRRTQTTATNLSAPIVERYNARGQRISLQDSTGTTTFVPDVLGRIKQVVAPTGNVTYGYNALGQRTMLGYPDGTQIDYTYTPDGQMDQVWQGTTMLADYGYDSAGRLGSLSRANGALTSYQYDNADRLRIANTTVYGTPRHQISYTLNRRGQRVALDEATGTDIAPTPTAPPTSTPTSTNTPTPTNTPTNTPTATATPASGTVLFVAGSTTLNASDTTIKGLLESRGYTVIVKDATSSQTTDATGKTLILISSTVTSGNVNSKFRDVAVPVIVWEMALFDEMRMTGNVSGTDQGTTENVTTGNVVNASHPMAAGLSGAVTLTTSGQALSYGEPNANGVVIVRAGGANRSVLFGYDSCAILKDNVTQAPARRVGLFLNDNTAAVLAPNGTSLINAALTWALGSRPCINGATATVPAGGATATPTSLPPTATNTATALPATATNTATSLPATATPTTVGATATPTSVPPTATPTNVGATATPSGGTVLFVAGSTTLNASDTSIKGMLESRGYTVVAKKDTDAQTADATGKVLILISSTVTSGNVNTKFRDTSVPVIVWEMALFDDMRMTLNQNSDQGTTENVTTGTVVNASHPLAAGLSGAVTLTTSGQALTYGEPNANGVVIVRAGGSNRSVLFGYDSCAILKDSVTPAPARRVGLFLNNDTAVVLTPNGTALVNAAITWAVGSRPCINGATATPTAGGATATPTSVPPTATTTATSVPPTATNVPPTATATSIPPTATSTPVADTLVIRINAGSYADATYSGVLWKTDQYFSGGNTGNASTLTIAGTADQVLYQKTRTASSDLGSFSYAIPVPSAATYRVRLHFAETYWGATGGGAGGTGKRVFSVNLEGGTTELQNYDINAAVGPMTAVVKEYTIGVSDGTLNLDFSATVNRPIISAIEVFKVGGSGNSAPLSKGMLRPLMQSGTITYTTTIHTDYTYDHVGRLLTEQVLGQPATLYGYDRVGNRTSVSTNGITSTLAYDAANQVVGWQYDTAGNLLNDGTRSYAYDALGRMTTLGTTSNQYNGDGVLVRQSVGATQTTFVNDLLANLSQPLIIQRGTSFDRAVYGLERLSTTNQANTRTWYLSDGVGSVQLTLDDAGNVLTNPQYDAWGNVTNGTASAPFGFAGEYRDPTSGLTYLRARWYNPATGTLLGRDPFEGYAELPYSQHPFQYAYADPVRFVDPSGQKVISLWIAAFIAKKRVVFPYVGYVNDGVPDYVIDTNAVWKGNGRNFSVGDTNSKLWMRVNIDIDGNQSTPLITNLDNIYSFIDADQDSTHVDVHTARGNIVTLSGYEPPDTLQAFEVEEEYSKCNSSVRFQIGAVGYNVLMPRWMTAPIQWWYDISIESNGVLETTTVQGHHTAFPWHEIYMSNTGWIEAYDPTERFGPDASPALLFRFVDVFYQQERVVKQR